MAPPRDRRPGFSRRAQYGVFLGYVVAGFGLLVAVALLLVSTLSPATWSGARMGVAELTTPVSSGLAAIVAPVAAIPNGIGSWFGVRRENERLRREVATANRLLGRARTLTYENRRLKALLQLREAATTPIVTASLVSSSATSTRRFATLNAGWRQGVREGQPVRGPDGLIGRILEAGPDTARVLLLSDAESAVPVRRTRDGVAAIAAGRGDGLLEVRSASFGSTLFHKGDVFVTSGAGGIYPPNIPVVRVVRDGRDTALGQPATDPSIFDVALVEGIYMPPLVPRPVTGAGPAAAQAPAPAPR